MNTAFIIQKYSAQGIKLCALIMFNPPSKSTIKNQKKCLRKNEKNKTAEYEHASRGGAFTVVYL